MKIQLDRRVGFLGFLGFLGLLNPLFYPFFLFFLFFLQQKANKKIASKKKR